ncbi:MAG: hypothetical protein ACLRFH_04875 [Opitutales bacterium]
MRKKDACNTDLSLDSNVGYFLNHVSDYSEGQVMEFLKSVYAASQDRIAKGNRLVANDAYPDEDVLDKAVEKFLK